MTDNIPVSGMPNLPQPPSTPAVFGFSSGNQDSALLGSALQQSQAVVDNLKSGINHNVVNQFASSAVSTDSLKQQIEYGMQNTLGSAAEAAIKMQGPIQQQVISGLGSVLESTIPLGVVPPNSDGSIVDPICVTVKNEAAQGIATTAGQYYLQHGGTLGLPMGQQQLQARQFLQDCVSSSPDSVAVVLRRLTDMDNAATNDGPNGAMRVASGGALTVPSVSEQMRMTADQNLQKIQQTSQPASGWSQSANQPANITQVQQSAVQPTLQVSATGLAIPATVGNSFGIDPNGNICAQLQSMDLTALNAALGPLLDHPYGQASKNTINLGSKSNNMQPGFVGPESFTLILQRIAGPANGYNYAITASSPMPGYGGQSTCFVPTDKVVEPVEQPVQQQTPSTLPAGCCPPPNIVVNCGDKAKSVETTTAKPCPKYNLYCTKAGIFYATRTDQPKRSDDDKLLASGDPAEWQIKDAIDKCRKESSGEDKQPEMPAVSGIQSVGLDGCFEFGQVPALGVTNGYSTLLQYLGFASPDGNSKVPFPDAGVTDIFQNAVNSIMGFFTTIFSQQFDTISKILMNSPCADGQMMALMVTEGALGFLQQWLGADLSILRTPNSQQRHFRCPVDLPDWSAAASAFLGNQIDKKTLECWVRADNKRYPEFKSVIDSQRSKLSALQLATALRRQYITQQQYDTNIRESGYIREMDGTTIYKLTEQIPPPGDIVRMMVRDSADEPLAEKFKLDKLFTDKYVGQLKDWGEQQGIPEHYMKFLWRAHWSIPAPGQLANMLHRLSRLPQGDPAYVDLETIKQALYQQDIAPYWVDKFIAISYNPLTRIDARRAFEIGALGKQGLKEAYLNLGYNSENADTLVAFNEKNINRTFLRRPEIKQLALGEISNAEYVSTMDMFGASEYAIMLGRTYAGLLRSKNRRQKCIKAIRKRFLSGDLNQQEAVTQLLSLDVQPDTANELVAGWKCEQHTTGKQISATQAISLYQDQIISESDLARRLQNVGYSYEDAVILVRQQQRKAGLRASKDELSAMRRTETENLRIRHQIEQQQAKDESKKRREESSAKRMRDTKVAREKRLIEAGFKFAKNAGINPADGVVFIKSLYSAVLQHKTVTYDEAIQAILLAAQDKDIKTQTALNDAVYAAVQNVSNLSGD